MLLRYKLYAVLFNWYSKGVYRNGNAAAMFINYKIFKSKTKKLEKGSYTFKMFTYMKETYKDFLLWL